MDEGLGTTYERFVLHRYFEKIRKTYAVESVLEAPSFGMTGISGINSMWWAYSGKKVVIADDHVDRMLMAKKVWEATSMSASFVCCKHESLWLPFGDGCFDMSWTFASLSLKPNLINFLSEIVRITKKVIFIVMPNTSSATAFCCSGPGHNDTVRPEGIVDIMANLHWSVDEKGFLDAPPWPDIAMKKEDLLRRIGLERLADRLQARKYNPICILDYYKGLRPNMEREFLKYGFLENLPKFLKRFWAHHWYIILVPKKGGSVKA